jgi:hypothetical protein
MNLNPSSNPIPVFNPSPETELLCQDVQRDANGRVFAHLLRQVDVAKQQNAHIIREQMQSAEAREKILQGITDHTVQFKRHEEQDAIAFAAIRAAQNDMNDWRKTWFGKKGVLALVATAMVYVGYDSLLKPMLERIVHPTAQKP